MKKRKIIKILYHGLNFEEKAVNTDKTKQKQNKTKQKYTLSY